MEEDSFLLNKIKRNSEIDQILVIPCKIELLTEKVELHVILIWYGLLLLFLYSTKLGSQNESQGIKIGKMRKEMVQHVTYMHMHIP